MSSDAAGSHTSWDIESVNPEREMVRLLGMADSLTVRHFRRVLEKLPENCTSIEIGSGLGKMSFFLALLGTDVHLLDSSAKTLKEAASFYSYCKLPVKLHECDALSLPNDLAGQFDLSLSLGVNEHFSGQARQSIFEVHHGVLKRGGRSVIAVPNRHCASYRVAMIIWKLTGRWPEGLYEYGFSRSELARRMQLAGFTEVEVVSGSYALDDFRYYITGNIKAALRKLGMVKKTKLEQASGNENIPSVNEIRKKMQQTSAPEMFRNHQSHEWIATGVRP